VTVLNPQGDSVKWNDLNPPDLPDWSSFFSQVICVAGHGVKHVFISGQVGVEAEKQLAGDGGLEAHTKRACENLGTALARATIRGWGSSS
jgi:enamine deaminase RidA (YjgF/YER057c/UK114 family)